MAGEQGQPATAGGGNFLTPAEVKSAIIETAVKKAALRIGPMFLLAIAAGAFIAFAAAASNTAIHALATKDYGVARTLAGAIFAAGLMMVVIAGGELFTGNMLMVTGVLAGKIRLRPMLRNWLVVYTGNFAGALLVVLMMKFSGLWEVQQGLIGGFTVKVAALKASLGFGQAFFLGVLCNWLVCLAVWMATAARDIAGKAVAIFFPIALFIILGYEHSVANMYYIPAGILAAANDALRSLCGLGETTLSNLTWSAMLLKNLLPVTLGNILGGSVLVGALYFGAFSTAKHHGPSR